MIILTKAQADHVRGVTSENSRLDPVAIKGGLYVLPDAVLSDDCHALRRDYLSTLPIREVLASELISTEE